MPAPIYPAAPYVALLGEWQPGPYVTNTWFYLGPSATLTVPSDGNINLSPCR